MSKQINMPVSKLKVLMISSSGGHWVQMNRVRPAFDREDLYFASTDRHYSQTNPTSPFFYIPEASRTSGLLTLIWQALNVLKVLLQIRPHIIVTTGAATGFFAVFLGKKLGAKTIWIDSIANIDSLSLSGQKAKRHADLFITQWQELVEEGGALFFGKVI